MAYVNLKLTTAGAEPVKSSSKELQVSQRGYSTLYLIYY